MQAPDSSGAGILRCKRHFVHERQLSRLRCRCSAPPEARYPAQYQREEAYTGADCNELGDAVAAVGIRIKILIRVRAK